MSASQNTSWKSTNQQKTGYLLVWYSLLSHLYKDRNYREAQFLWTILPIIWIPRKAKVLDSWRVAKGHSIFLNQLGFTGTWYRSENSISPKRIKTLMKNYNSKFAWRTWTFERKIDAIFNLFRFWLFWEMMKTTWLRYSHQSLSEYGFAVIDFMNVNLYWKLWYQKKLKRLMKLISSRGMKRGHIYI
jgi:hypothetical protein